MSRAIDAVQALNNINWHHRPTPVNQFDSGFNQGLNQAMWEITHAPTLTPPNEPLTWDELGTMIEKPVYIVEMENGKSYWALVYTVSDTGTLLASAIDLNDYGSRKLYGKSWLAYRHPPEGDEDT